jgi:superfamily II DNA helicase RecQ
VDFNGNVTLGAAGWKKTYAVQAAYRREQLDKVLRYVDSHDCRMCALVRHFGDVADAGRGCGQCDVCDPAGAVLRLFRRATSRERNWVQDVVEVLRPAAYKTPKGLRTELRWAEAMDRDEFEGLLGAMSRAGLIETEEAEFEKDGKVIPFRKISLTEVGMDAQATTQLALFFSDGIVEEFGGARRPSAKKAATPKRQIVSEKARAAAAQDALAAARASLASNPRSFGTAREAAVPIEGRGAELAARLKEWRAAEAKRLGVPAYLVLHDRTLNALAISRPRNPGELLGIEGMGPSKVGRFGEKILELCRQP